MSEYFIQQNYTDKKTSTVIKHVTWITLSKLQHEHSTVIILIYYSTSIHNC